MSKSEIYRKRVLKGERPSQDDNAKKLEALESRNRVLTEALEWASGQFQGIRLYTQDGKIATACADGESKIKNLNTRTPQEGE